MIAERLSNWLLLVTDRIIHSATSPTRAIGSGKILRYYRQSIHLERDRGVFFAKLASLTK